MPDLIAKSPLAGQGALTLGEVTLAEGELARVTSVAPLRGQEEGFAKGLAALGLAFPAPNRFVESAGARIVWTAREQAFLIGADPEGLGAHAALTDQSDGWATLRLDGPGAEAALVRIVPLDLRITAFAVGHAARVPFNHMSSILMRVGPQTFEVMVFRSMARTAWHEVDSAMRALAARARA